MRDEFPYLVDQIHQIHQIRHVVCDQSLCLPVEPSTFQFITCTHRPHFTSSPPPSSCPTGHEPPQVHQARASAADLRSGGAARSRRRGTSRRGRGLRGPAREAPAESTRPSEPGHARPCKQRKGDAMWGLGMGMAMQACQRRVWRVCARERAQRTGPSAEAVPSRTLYDSSRSSVAPLIILFPALLSGSSKTLISG